MKLIFSWRGTNSPCAAPWWHEAARCGSRALRWKLRRCGSNVAVTPDGDPSLPLLTAAVDTRKGRSAARQRRRGLLPSSARTIRWLSSRRRVTHLALLLLARVLIHKHGSRYPTVGGFLICVGVLDSQDLDIESPEYLVQFVSWVCFLVVCTVVN